MSTSIDPRVAVATPVERRFYPRVTPSVPIYIAFGPSNLGTLLNVSENGLQVGTPTRLEVNSVYRIFLCLTGAPSTITVTVRTVWTADPQNCSGIQLLDLSEEDREQIRKWVASQTAKNGNVEHWFSPKIAEPSVASEPFSPPALEPAPTKSVATERESTNPAAPAAAQPAAAEATIEPQFPPIPLPIHGEFTYEPPSPREKKILRRRERHLHRRSRRSRISQPVVWTLVISAICVGAVWSVQHKLYDRLLHRPALLAQEDAQPRDANTSVRGPDAATSPIVAEIPSDGDNNADARDVNKNADHDADLTSTDSTPDAAPKASPNFVPPTPAAPRRSTPTASASKPNLGSLPDHSAQPEAPEVSRSYVPDSTPLLTSNDRASSARIPTPDAPSAANTFSPSAATTRTSSTAPPQSAAVRPAGKSAIVGSILNSSRTGDFPADGDSGSSASAEQPSRPAMSHANSFASRNSSPGDSGGDNAVNSAVIQMDVPEPRVIEVTPPRSLTGNLTASYVNLPGERVLRSGPVTMHIQRSVKIPGDRIPGQRWLWRGHKKVVLGELSSRVDPQVSQLPVPNGAITVLASIDKDGYISNVKPLYGSFAFLPNVTRAIHDWRYQPTYLDDKPIETQAQIEIDFHQPTRTSRP